MMGQGWLWREGEGHVVLYFRPLRDHQVSQMSASSDTGTRLLSHAFCCWYLVVWEEQAVTNTSLQHPLAPFFCHY